MVYEMLKDGVKVLLDAHEVTLVKKQLALIERRFWHWNGSDFITLGPVAEARFITRSHARNAIGEGWSEALEKMHGMGYIEPAEHPYFTLRGNSDDRTGFTYTGVGRAIVDESRDENSWTKCLGDLDAGTV